MPALAVIFVAVPPVFVPKTAARPFSKIESREVFMRTIELYANRDQIQQRVLAVHTDDLELIQQKYSAHLGFQGVQVTAAGPDWFGVVARGLEKLKPEIDTVIIHDACCPAVPYTLLDSLEAALAKAPAAALAVPVNSHLAQLTPISGGLNHLGASVDSSAYHEIQSPQIFSRALLTEAYAKRPSLSSASQKPSDDASLLRLCGHDVALVPGSRYNLRIDSEESLRLAGDFLKHLPKPRPKGPLTPFGEAEW